MHHPQFTLKMMLWLVALVAAFFGTLGRVDGPFALFLLIVWGAVLAGCIGAMWSRAHALLCRVLRLFPPFADLGCRGGIDRVN